MNLEAFLANESASPTSGRDDERNNKASPKAKSKERKKKEKKIVRMSRSLLCMLLSRATGIDGNYGVQDLIRESHVSNRIFTCRPMFGVRGAPGDDATSTRRRVVEFPILRIFYVPGKSKRASSKSRAGSIADWPLYARTSFPQGRGKPIVHCGIFFFLQLGQCLCCTYH